MSVRNRAKACEFGFFARVRIDRANCAKPCESVRANSASAVRKRASAPLGARTIRTHDRSHAVGHFFWR